MNIDTQRNLAKILAEIEAERKAQDAKWGEQNHSPIEWSAILTEECGEVAKEALEFHFQREKNTAEWSAQKLQSYRKELIQVAAVAVAMIESLERN